ncbi:MAG TPA: class I SAM-dependent rRNA methyltransferase [Ktedonobacterales bacterium]|nr:class I SAM-dependent rRNA methyltransferase [Ktedonobacterales bacterium]
MTQLGTPTPTSTPPTLYPTLRLRPGREYALLNGHPWLFSGAFQNLSELPRDTPPGAVVDVIASVANGAWVARGHLNANNSLAFRALTLDHDEVIDQAFYERRITRALRLRRLLPPTTNAYRLIHAEADGLPGLIVDRYDHWLVAQFHTVGVERQRDLIIPALVEAIAQAEDHPIEGIVARDEVKVREREGLAVGGASVVYGLVPDNVEIVENGVRYFIDPLQGQKTGFFLDQRDKRARIAELARQATDATSLLNLYSYSGGFALAALAGRPALRTVNVDSSAPALELARRNYALNQRLSDDAHQFVAEDVTRYLRGAITADDRFDIVVVDPPAFAKTQQMKDRALRAYEALNTLAIQVVAPGGVLLTCSCSGSVSADEFEGAVRQGLRLAKRSAQIVGSFGPSLDHPTLPGFVEDRYLKALLLIVE